MPDSNSPSAICLSVLIVSALVLSVTARAQERPPAAIEMAKTYGINSFGQIEKLRYTWNLEVPGMKISHTWEWEPKTGQVSYQSKDKEGKPVNVTYQRSQLDAQSETVKNEIDPAFINDQYWLLLPLHVAWDGAEVIDEGMNNLPLGQGSAERLVVKYPSEGGYAPGDTWELYLGADHQVKEIIYRGGDVGGPQEGRASPYSNRSPGHGRWCAATGFLIRRVRQADGIRHLDERSMKSGHLFGK